MTARIHNYSQAAQYLGAKDNRPAGNNTRVIRRSPSAIAVTLHGSDVVTYYPGRTVLDSCGYRTHTTKDRINGFGPDGFYVWQERGQWYLQAGPRDAGRQWNFADGIEVTDSGEVTGAGADSQAENERKVRGRIAKYVRKYMDALIAGKIEKPGPGDCFFCQFRDVKKGQNIGENWNVDHLASHFEESYFVPSLLYNAIEAFPVSPIANSRLAEIWHIFPDNEHGPSTFADAILKEQAGKSLIKYLRRQFRIG